jgi:acetyl-CoA C-acetyltransferase
MSGALDPRLPVLVGAGQLSNRPDRGDPEREPADLMVEALRRAEADSAGRGLLAATDVVHTVAELSWRYPNVGRLVAEQVGASPRRYVQSVMGGNLAGSMVNAAARAVQAGDADVVVVCGGEAWRTRSRARAEGRELDWTTQPDDTPPPEPFGVDHPLNSDVERARGVSMPVEIYPLFDVALRARLGLGIDEHRDRIGTLWSAFSRVAVGNPHAWIREAFTAEQVSRPTPENRMVAFPYTKRLCSNNAVDQGSAVVITSVEAAERHGVPRENWVFLHAGADAVDHWYVSERADLCSSPAIRLAGRDVFALAGIGPDDLDHVDLYSCFPSAVQIAATELGLAPSDGAGGWGGIGSRLPLTVTGGMTFAGGPWNAYPLHGLATMARVLRADPGSRGLCTANGGYTTEHAMVVLSSEPPTAGAFRHAEPQAEVDALPRVELDDAHTGPVTVESATVLHDRAGPVRAVVAARTPSGQRTWCTTADPDLLATVETEELVGRPGTRHPDARFSL